MAVDFADFDDSGHVPLLEVTARLKQALDIEGVTKKFYGEFQEQHVAFIELIEGIGDERDRRWYASVLLNRLMFIYFLQKKFFLDGPTSSISRTNSRRARRAVRTVTTPVSSRPCSSRASRSLRTSALRKSTRYSARSSISTEGFSCRTPSNSAGQRSPSRTRRSEPSRPVWELLLESERHSRRAG